MLRTSISMTWTPGVEADEAQVFVHTLEDIYSLLRRHFGTPGQFDPLPMVRIFGAWMIPAVPHGAAFWGVEWYVQRCLDAEQKRLLGSRYIETVAMEPWQNNDPHLDLALTNLSLVNDQAPAVSPPEVLGIARPGLLMLISSKLLQDIDEPALRNLALRHLVAHYFGRLLDIPCVHRTADTLQVEGVHYCTNQCAMRYTDTPTLALSFGQQQIAAGTLYCDPCQHDLVAQLAGYHYGLN